MSLLSDILFHLRFACFIVCLNNVYVCMMVFLYVFFLFLFTEGCLNLIIANKDRTLNSQKIFLLFGSKLLIELDIEYFIWYNG